MFGGGAAEVEVVLELPIGALVKVVGLEKNADANGSQGTVVDNALNPQGKIQVDLSGTLASVWPKNLELVVRQEGRDPRRILFIILASFVTMVGGSYACDTADDCSGERGYATASGVVSLAVCGWYVMYLSASNPTQQQKLRMTHYVASFLAVWWVVAAFITTTRQPFTTRGTGGAGNGFFAVWVAMLESLYFGHSCSPLLQGLLLRLIDDDDVKFAAFQMVAAGVLLAQAVMDCDMSSNCEDELAFAVAAAVIALVVLGVYVVLPLRLRNKASPVVAYASSVGWLVTVWVLTFNPASPYPTSGNGFFASWIALGAAGMWAVQQLSRGGTLIVTKADS